MIDIKDIFKRKKKPKKEEALNLHLQRSGVLEGSEPIKDNGYFSPRLAKVLNKGSKEEEKAEEKQLKKDKKEKKCRFNKRGSMRTPEVEKTEIKVPQSTKNPIERPKAEEMEQFTQKTKISQILKDVTKYEPSADTDLSQLEPEVSKKNLLHILFLTK